MPLLLLTRPEPAARRFAAEAAGFGWPVVVSPALRIVPVAHDGAALAAAAGLVFTSENAVPFAGPGRGRRAICVGPRTAEVARAAGFDAEAGPGDAARLVPLLAGLGPGWLHPHGKHIARALPVAGVAVYDQQPVALNRAALDALAGVEPVVLPLFSPRTAAIVSDQAGGALAPLWPAPLWIAPISAAADRAWRTRAERRAVAPTPDGAGIIAALGRLAGGQHS